MPNIRQYRYLHKGENEWLSEPPQEPDMQEEWAEQWKEIKAEHKDIKIEFTEDMYLNAEYADTPEWINITIDDSGVLPFKMARGIIGALDGAKSIVFHSHFSVDISSEWGGWSHCHLEVYGTNNAYLTVVAKHSSEELEVNITEQFNQAIGEG
jgi:hypothetical protein